MTDTEIEETEVAVNDLGSDHVSEEVVPDHENENPVVDQDHVIMIERDVQDQERGNQIGVRDPPGIENGGQDRVSETEIVEIEPPTVTMK
jgi:hypothetical protein